MERKLTAAEREEYAADARNILNSPAVAYVFEQMRVEYTNKLIQCEVGSLTAATAHASMKVLAELEARLKQFDTDIKMSATRGNRI